VMRDSLLDQIGGTRAAARARLYLYEC